MFINKSYLKPFLLVILLGLAVLSCKNKHSENIRHIPAKKHIPVKKRIPQVNKESEKKNIQKNWVELIQLDSTFVLDLRYATTNNFVHKKMYPCPKCFVRPELAKELLAVQNDLKKYGYRLKLFDCYRPGKIQKELWKIKPDPRYVANPKKGSMHNRGVAVDVSIVDANGQELDMGTPFDYFGKKAYHAYKNLPKKVLKNRLLLKNVMLKHGLQPITSEWWHYSYRKKNYPVEHWVWNCDATKSH